MKIVNIRRQKGISIVIVIFMLAVLAALVVSLRNIGTTQTFNSAFSARGVQAYFAARSGLDYAIARIAAGAVCGGISSSVSVAGYNVDIGCQLVGNYDEGDPSAPYNVFLITSTASSGGFQAPDVTTRQLRATVKFP